MEFSQTAEEVAKLLARAIRAELTEDRDTYFFAIRGLESRAPVCLTIHRAELDALIAQLQQKSFSDQMVLHDDLYFEAIVQEEAPIPSRLTREGLLNVADRESGFEYEVSPLSNEYLVRLLAFAADSRSLRDLTSFPIFRHRALRLLESESVPDLLDFVRGSFARYSTLKIRVTSAQSLRRFNQAASAFLFHIAYNMDVALVRVRHLEELSRRGRIGRIRRSRPGDLDPPRRIYNEDLVSHYVLAVSTDSPTVQFLSYYHMLEHYFESVFNDDLIEQIKGAITHPGFSYKRKKDIGQLVSTIKKSLQIRSETITFSELEALRLSLVKYVDLPQLAAELNSYDATLLDYYRTQAVPFSNGPQVDLSSLDHEKSFKDLSKRIYATRNALVHSKDGDKARYVPFRDERALFVEIPLMRFVAEMVVLAESQLV